MTKKELSKKAKEFMNVAYPTTGKHLSLRECIGKITGDKNSTFFIEDDSVFLMVKGRKFKLEDLYCPDMKESYAYIFDEDAKMCFTYGPYLIIYAFYDEEIGRVQIDRKDENGKYRNIYINGRELLEAGSELLTVVNAEGMSLLDE